MLSLTLGVKSEKIKVDCRLDSYLYARAVAGAWAVGDLLLVLVSALIKNVSVIIDVCPRTAIEARLLYHLLDVLQAAST